MDFELVSEYTNEQAEQDGILVSIGKIHKGLDKCMFNYITTNLLEKEYIYTRGVNVEGVMDLVAQAFGIVRKASNNFQSHDWFYKGEIELPDGRQQEVFICQNDTGRYTIMLPRDY
jgi:hypothetical protein